MQNITSISQMPDMRQLGALQQVQTQQPLTAQPLVDQPEHHEELIKEIPTIHETPVVESDVDDMLSTLNQQLEVNGSHLRFQRDDDLGKMVLGIYDTTTEELIRQVPSESLLALSKQIGNYLDALNNLPASGELPPGSLFDRLV